LVLKPQSVQLTDTTECKHMIYTLLAELIDFTHTRNTTIQQPEKHNPTSELRAAVSSCQPASSSHKYLHFPQPPDILNLSLSPPDTHTPITPKFLTHTQPSIIDYANAAAQQTKPWHEMDHLESALMNQRMDSLILAPKENVYQKKSFELQNLAAVCELKEIACLKNN